MLIEQMTHLGAGREEHEDSLPEGYATAGEAPSRMLEWYAQYSQSAESVHCSAVAVTVRNSKPR
jgi:hypothetical protein